MLPGDGTQLGGQGEGEQEVWYRQQEGVLLGKPGWSSILLAGRAVAVATGMVAVTRELTGRASVDVTAKRLSPARFDRLHSLQLACGQRAATARAIGRPIAAEDLA